MPGLLAGGASSLGSLFTLANGIGNLIKGHRMHPERPTYEIPDEIKQQLGLRQNLLNAGLPGEQQARQDIYGSQANATSGLFRAANDQSQLLSGLGSIYAGTNNALNNLEAERERNYYNNLSGLEGAQNNMAAYKDKAFQVNKMDPYMMNLQRKYDLQNTGNQDILSGLNGLSSIAGSLMGMNAGASGGGMSGSSGVPSTSATPINPIAYTPQLQGISPLSQQSLGSASLAPMGSLGSSGGGAGGLLSLIMSNPEWFAAL